MSAINRLDPEHLKAWRAEYRLVFDCFTDGSLPLLVAIDALRSLGFKDEALKIEILELHKAKREVSGPALELVAL